jgi:DNA-binding NtrC family response regulator
LKKGGCHSIADDLPPHIGRTRPETAVCSDRISAVDVPSNRGTTNAPPCFSGMSMADIERQAICQTLEQTSGCRSAAGRILGVSVRTLQRKIKQYNLPF